MRTDLKKMILGMSSLLALLWGCTACSSKSSEPAGQTRPLLTVTIEPQRYFVEAVAGDRFEVKSMVPKGSSPETYDPTPQQLVGLSRSVAYLRIGYLGFEVSWFDKLLQNAPRMKPFDLSEGVRPIREAHAHGGHAGGVEPHIWMSAVNARLLTEHIRAALITLDPAHAAEYTQRADSLKQVIAATDSTVRALLPGEGTAFLIYHPSLSYFARDYGLRQIAIEEGGKEPSPAHLKALIEESRAQGAKVIFVQPEFDVRNARSLSEDLHLNIVTVNPLSYDWPEEMIRVAQALQDAAL